MITLEITLISRTFSIIYSLYGIARQDRGELTYWIEFFKKIAVKFVSSLYTDMNNPKSKNAILFIIASKIIKSIRINLMKEAEVFYTEKYKTLLKEI